MKKKKKHFSKLHFITNYHNLVYITFSLFKSTEDFDYANIFVKDEMH